MENNRKPPVPERYYPPFSAGLVGPVEKDLYAAMLAAKEAAEQAGDEKDAAVSAKETAEGSASDANDAKDAAIEAKEAAEDAKDDAVAAKEAAEAAAQTLVLDPTLTSATQAAQAKAVGDIVADVLETEYTQELIAQNTADDPTTLEHVQGYLFSGDDTTSGRLSGTTNPANNTWYLLADNDMDVYPVPITQQTTKCRIGVFHTSPYGENNRVTPVYQGGNESYPLPTANNPLHVGAGQYVSISFYNAGKNPLWELYKIVDVTYALKSSTPLTDTQNDEVDTKIKNTATGDGYLEIDGTWARGEWTSYTNHTSRTYRVRLEEPISFNHDVYLMASPGFYFTGIFENGETFNGERLGYVLRANEKAKISVRRISEITSETADIDVFSKGVKVATLCAGIERYRPTFTDISMFERVGVCGDSYASGGGIISGIRPLTWGKNLERQAGITVDIYAKSGQDVVAWVTDSTNGLPALLAGAECGLYWLQHGINGTSTPERLGTPSDMTASPRPATFYGQYAEAIEQIKTAFPNARIVLATITGSSYGLYQTIYSGVNTAIRNIAQYCEVPVVDVVDDDFYKSLWYSSSIRSNHPTAMLCAGMAMANRRLVSKCIMDNPDYFVNYGSN